MPYGSNTLGFHTRMLTSTVDLYCIKAMPIPHLSKQRTMIHLHTAYQFEELHRSHSHVDTFIKYAKSTMCADSTPTLCGLASVLRLDDKLCGLASVLPLADNVVWTCKCPPTSRQRCVDLQVSSY